MLVASSYRLWGKGSGGLLDFTPWIVALKMSEGLSASRSTINVTLASGAKPLLSQVVQGSEFLLQWGYSSSVYRQASAFWTQTEWNVGGNNTVSITLVNLGQWSLARSSQTAVALESKTPATDIAKQKLVDLKGEKTTTVKSKVMRSNPLGAIQKDNPESFIKWDWSPKGQGEIVSFADLAKKSQVVYIDTLKGYVGELKITYAAQLPKDQTFAEVLSKGVVPATTANSPAPESLNAKRAQDPNSPKPENDSSQSFGLFSYHIIDAETGSSISSRNALATPPEGTSLLKLCIALVIRDQIQKGQYSISSSWSGATVVTLLKQMLDSSDNIAANKLVARAGGLEKLNQSIRTLGFLETSLLSLYGESVKKRVTKNLPWERYRSAALAANYNEKYGETLTGDIYPEVKAAIDKMRAASGFALRQVSGFRSFAAQEPLFKANGAESNAPPGYSQHHTGWAVDLVSADSRQISQYQNEFNWLKNNCNKYGFMISYPNIPGLDLGAKPEPWHVAYVGTREAMGVFYEFITRARALGYDPIAGSEQLKSLYDNHGGSGTDKKTNAYEMAKAMSLILKGTDPASVTIRKFLEGSNTKVDGQNYVKLGFTKNVEAFCGNFQLANGKNYVACAYGVGLKAADLSKNFEKLWKTIPRN